MQPRADVLGEQHVTGDDRFLGDRRPAGQAQLCGDDALVHLGAVGQARILGVLRDDAVERLDVFERTTHDQRVPDAEAVVAEDADASAGSGHRPELGETLALLPDSDGADRLHRGVAGGLAEGEFLLDHAGRVGHGLGVRHGEHRGESARGGRLGARQHGLGCLETGLAEVRVQVDQSGQGDEAGSIDDACTAAGGAGTDLDDDAVLDRDVGAAATEQLGAGDDEVPVHFASPRSSLRSPASSR